MGAVEVTNKNQGCVYFKSGIGNLIQATPAIQALASMDQTGQVDVCLDETWAARDGRVGAMRDMFDAMPFVGETFLYPSKRQAHYTRWFMSIMCETSKAGHWVLSKTVLNKWPAESWRENMRHEVDVNMNLLRRLCGYKGTTPKKYMPVAQDGPDLSGLNRPVIGLCNGAFGAQMWQKKRWPYFADLARILRGYYGGTLVGVGGARELPRVALDRDYTGRLPILESAKVIQQLDLLITTDTACMHIADAVGTRTLALFGPTLTSKNAPRGHHCTVVRAPLECAPCQHFAAFHSCEEYACMKQISPGLVMSRVREIMNRRSEWWSTEGYEFLEGHEKQSRWGSRHGQMRGAVPALRPEAEEVPEGPDVPEGVAVQGLHDGACPAPQGDVCTGVLGA